MLRDGSTQTSDREVALSKGRTALYATRPKTPARLIRATRCPERVVWPRGDDDLWTKRDELSHERGDLLRLGPRVAILDLEIPAHYITTLA